MREAIDLTFRLNRSASISFDEFDPLCKSGIIVSMNRFNDPDDFLIADAVVEKMLELKPGEIATIQELVYAVAPGWEPEDLDLSGIDFQVRKIAKERKILLLTLPEFRENPEAKPYQTPFKVMKLKYKTTEA